MMEPEADLGADAPLPVDVTVTGGHFSQAVLGTQIVNKNTVVHQHVDVDVPALPPESRLQSDSAAIFSGITVGEVRGSAIIDSKAKDMDENAATADTRSLDSTALDPAKEQDEKPARGTEKSKSSFGNFLKFLDRESAEGIEENVATPDGTEKKNSTLGSFTQKMRTNIADVKRNLQGYGVRVRRLTRDFQFGKEWEGKFSDQKVTIMQFNEDDAEKYEYAVDVLTNLEHENIVHFIKEIPEDWVIITDFCEYGTLKEYLAGGGKRAELSDLLRMAAQIALGMDFLHRKKYVHCDLRAGNVAVTGNLLCKISGFGMARHVGLRGGSSIDKNAILTKWAAQEVIQKGYVSFKSDVWSFGVVLWEIVTRGGEPYSGLSAFHISIGNGHRMLKPKQCPSGLYFDIMMPCWNKDPDARPTFECLEKSLLSFDVEAEQKDESVTVRALQDCPAESKGTLRFKEGDIIVNCAASSAGAGWARGTLDGKTGKFSANYVVQIKTHEA